MYRDKIVYLAEVASWLDKAPESVFEYGRFTLGAIEVCFDGEVIGDFYNDGIDWQWTEKNEKA